MVLAATACWSQVRITSVDPGSNEVVLTNMGGSMEDVSTWWLCNFPSYNQISSLTTVGPTNMMAGGTLTITWPALTGASGECGLYHTGGAFANSANMEDYMAWGSAGHMREGVAVTAGVWCTGEFITGLAPYSFIGTMVDYCVQYWAATPATYDITFQVDMNNECVSPDGVRLAGNFSADGYPEWDPAGIALSDADLDGVYDVTLTLSEGNSYSFKYVNGNAWGQDEGNIPVPCGTDNNRTMTVPSMNDVLALHCYASCDPCAAATHDLTLQVDMSDETVDAAGVHVMGDFNGWDPAADAMTDMGSGIWSITLAVTAGAGVEYKFVNGNVGGNAETVPMACGVDDGGGAYNRSLDCIGDVTVIDPVCFGACDACASSIVNVTFQVDMTGFTVNPIGVFIAGSMQSIPWTPGADQLTDVGAGVHEITFALATGTVVEYKYLNGPDWPNEETVPAACGVDNGIGGFNRQWTVGASDETVPLHCFSSCLACAAVPVNVTFQVDMQNEAVSPNGVHVAGSFQGWDPATTEMTDPDLDNIYTVTLPILPGSIEQYKFINGDTWPENETVPAECAVGGNREHTVGGSDESVPVVCFGSCIICNPPLVNVTFEVDMQNEVVSANGVHLAGSFQGWDPAATPMTDPDLDDIYSVTVAIPQGTPIEYKFINDNDFAGAETVPAECETNTNRSHTVGAADESLPVVCFSSCTACPLPMVNVTFQVDMSEQVVSANGVHIAGDFQGWDPATTMMDDPDLDDVYTVTIAIEAGSTVQYKFINANDWPGAETVPVGCEVGGNREHTVALVDETVPVVCFGSCTVCAPPTVDVTFQVDMNNEVVSAFGVHVAGSFQGWDPATTMMDDPDLDGVYTVTVSIAEGEVIQYKFINGNDWPDSETVPGECETGGNREHTVGNTNESIPVVCFGSCTVCDPPTVNVTFRVDMFQQTLDVNGVHLVGSMQGWDPAATPMTNVSYGIYEVTVEVPQNSTQEFLYINGNDFSGQETLITIDCGVDNGLGGYNRELVVGTSDMLLDVVCFDSCQDCMGCTNPFFAEYNPFAVGDDGSCSLIAVPGCTYPDAENFDPLANQDNGTCTFSFTSSCPGDLNEDGIINTIDLLQFLGFFGTVCP